MKDSIQNNPNLDTGRRYWRSLDDLADTAEFKAWVENEFPAGASELSDDFTRRDFVKLMSASFLLAGFGLTGCRRPVETIVPFSKKPENYIHGVPQFYATSMPERGGAIPLLARSNDGRPTKLEGNHDHPNSSGSTNVHAQASILNLYDPDRATQFKRGKSVIGRDVAMDILKAESAAWRAKRGNGLCLLLEESTSPSRARLLDTIQSTMPYAKIATYEPISNAAEQLAAEMVAGRPCVPYYNLKKAKVILSLDCDFLGSEKDQIRHTRDFSAGRKVGQPDDPMNRLYAVEGLMSLTGANADHRLRVPTGSVLQIAAQIASQILIQSGDSSSPVLTALQAFGWVNGVNPQWVNECAKDLLAHRGHAVVLAGYRQPTEVHLIALVINAALGSLGNAVVFQKPLQPRYAGIETITQALNAGQADTLIVIGGNPVYNAPMDYRWPEAVHAAKKLFRLGYHHDETSVDCDLLFPATHFLESWGDARSSDGSLVGIQPLIAPLFDGISELEFLATIAGEDDPSAHSVVRATFRQRVGDANFEGKWKAFLHRGFLEGSADPVIDVKLDHQSVSGVLAQSKLRSESGDDYEVVFFRDYSVDDGRYANNGWLQELPDPVTKITWDNAILISRQTAADLGLENGQVVKLESGGGSLEGPVWVQPGMADKSFGLALGYGRDHGGRVAGNKGKPVGFNAYKVRTSISPYIARGAKITPTGRKHPIACTQDHWSMEGRAIVREGNLSQYREKPDFARNMDLEAHSGHIPHDENGQPLGIYKHPYEARPVLKNKIHQWGMVIDLSACVGCSACVIACQSENNIPIVGKNQIARSREMHWLRVDRYFTGNPELKKDVNPTDSDADQVKQRWIDDPQMVNQPMMCQHCESAPCESVCPVNATVHDEEGLNVMVYNRCVGTRYCSNNCPYKVRRFNFFDYNKRPLDRLYSGPLASRPKEELDLIKLIKNPDVSVRMRGVMEKCTFCVQRIEQAKISQKVQARDSGDVAVPDGTIKTACEQACPAEAIVFGNVADPNSRVSKLKQQQKNYSVLGFLDTRPRLTYLAKLRNPNPSMPDYYDMPLSLKEYTEKMGSPMEVHHPDAGHDGSHGVTHSEEKGAH